MSRYKTKNTGTPEVHNARSKLDGLLQTLLDKKDESPVKEEPLDDNDPSGSSAPNTPSKKGSHSSRSSRKRRRGKEDASNIEMAQYHHTYVMKLFDRSVDLAQFEEDTPLYPICRAWMRNQPHNRNLAPREPSLSPERMPTDDEENSQDNSDVRAIFRLPCPTPIKTEPGMVVPDLRIPAQVPHTDDPLDIHADASLAPQPEQLLLNHMVRWRQIRHSWKDAGRQNEVRHEKSLKILRDMFDRQCKDQ